MGEIVDLESYRRRLKRKNARAQSGGNRRNPDRAATRGEAASAKGKPRFGETGKAGPAGKAKVEEIESEIESSDPKSE